MINKLFTKKKIFLLIALKMDQKLNKKLKSEVFLYKAWGIIRPSMSFGE